MTSVTTSAAVEEERQYWDEHAGDRLAVWGGNWDASVPPWLDAILPELDLQPGDDVLDLGCGPGRLTIPAAKRRPNGIVFGVDVSPGMIAAARMTGATTANAVFICNDGRTLAALRDESFDGAWSVLLFQHIPDDAVCRYLHEMSRVLSPRGRFRFQFATGTERMFLNYQRPVVDVTTWCDQAGLVVTAVDLGLLDPQSCFVTAVKT